MASKEMMKDTLLFLANVWPKKVTDDLVQGFYHVLKPYSDDNVYDAALKYIDEDNRFYPTPGKLKKLIPTKMYDDLAGEDFKIVSKMRCQNDGCLRKDVCIREPLSDPASKYICRDCYSGMTFDERKQKFKELFEMTENKKVKPKGV